MCCLLKELIIITLFYTFITNGDICPNKCICKQSIQRNGREWMKIKCGEMDKVNNFEELDLLNVANDLIQL